MVADTLEAVTGNDDAIANSGKDGHLLING